MPHSTAPGGGQALAITGMIWFSSVPGRIGPASYVDPTQEYPTQENNEGAGTLGCMHAEPPARTGTTTHPADLTWLLHRAAQRMRAALDQVARAEGLAGVRDWIVLSALIAQPGRTQLTLGHALGLDKTTLTSLLDRLETDGLIIRSLDPHDRRARIPEVTTAGRRIQARVTRARDHAEAELLQAFSAEEQRLLRDLLTRLAASQHDDCSHASGSCI